MVFEQDGMLVGKNEIGLWYVIELDYGCKLEFFMQDNKAIAHRSKISRNDIKDNEEEYDLLSLISFKLDNSSKENRIRAIKRFIMSNDFPFGKIQSIIMN